MAVLLGAESPPEPLATTWYWYSVPPSAVVSAKVTTSDGDLPTTGGADAATPKPCRGTSSAMVSQWMPSVLRRTVNPVSPAELSVQARLTVVFDTGWASKAVGAAGRVIAPASTAVLLPPVPWALRR